MVDNITILVVPKHPCFHMVTCDLNGDTIFVPTFKKKNKNCGMSTGWFTLKRRRMNFLWASYLKISTF